MNRSNNRKLTIASILERFFSFAVVFTDWFFFYNILPASCSYSLLDRLMADAERSFNEFQARYSNSIFLTGFIEFHIFLDALAGCKFRLAAIESGFYLIFFIFKMPKLYFSIHLFLKPPELK